MLWILAQMARKKEWPSRKTVVLCACDCAETSLQFVPEKENRPKIAIQTARKWAEGKATKIECAKAAYAAFAAYAAYADAAADAAHAAFAAAHTVDVVSAVAVDASAAFTADAYAADAYAAYAADVSSSSSSSSAAFDAKKEALRNMADIIRKRVTFEKE
jgi:hypothetical protein